MRYRITSTHKKGNTKRWQYWEGLCAEVTLGKKVVFDNAEYNFIRFNNGIRITDGPHKGFYRLEKL